jgi:hypothetical protein
MSGSIRDLVVSIDFSDIDVSDLIRVDSALNEIEDELRHLDHQIDDVGDEFTQMGIDAVLASAAAEAALGAVEDGANGAGHEVNGLGDAFSLTTLRVVGLGAMWTLVAAGAVAAAAPLLLAVGGLTASLAAAGVAAGAFGAVALPILTDLFSKEKEIETLQKKIDSAGTAKERIKAQKALAAAMEGVSKEERFALKELQNFKSFFGDFKKQFAPDVFNQFGTALHIVKELLKGLEPTIKAVSVVFTNLLETMDQNISGGGMQKFFDWLASNGAGALQNFATIGGNAIQGIMNIIMAFSPYGAMLEEKLVTLTDKFKSWSASFGQSQGFQNFVSYAMQNGPVLVDTISNLWDIFKKLIQDLAPLGTTVLGAIQGITSAVNDNWPAVSTTVLALAGGITAMVAAFKTMQVIGGIITLIKAFRTGTVLATLAAWGFNTALLANPFTWVAVGIGLLVAAGIALYKNWDTVKYHMAVAWEAIKSAAGAAVNFMIGKINGLIGGINTLLGAINKVAGTNLHIPTIGKVSWGGKHIAKNPVSSNDTTTKIGRYATGLERVPYNEFPSILHKDEAVLTAKQSNALRAAGVLSSTGGGKPKLDMGAQVAPTGKMRGGSTVFAPSVKVEVNGATGDAKEIGKQAAKAAKNELERLFSQLGLAFD